MMIYDLRLKYRPKPHPYADESPSPDEVWSEISIELFNSNGTIEKTILFLEWDVTVLISWFKENKVALFTEELPIPMEESSIAKSISSFYKGVPSNNPSDDTLDELFYYRQKHGIRFALRGVSIPDIYIGKVKNDYTISCAQSELWLYTIDLEKFFRSCIEIEKE